MLETGCSCYEGSSSPESSVPLEASSLKLLALGNSHALKPDKKKSSGLRSGDLAGHSTVPLRPSNG
ncbi:hypothetical protein J6590_080775 [Homalodisca vitripennis]|nr:hypothetical protein J6590_080775 [Homalodisca vitripennis]